MTKVEECDADLYERQLESERIPKGSLQNASKKRVLTWRARIVKISKQRPKEFPTQVNKIL
jgi:hypothetical protein